MPVVLFHQMPPIRLADPEVAFPILKGHLERNGVSSRTLYWNLLLKEIYGRVSDYSSEVLPKINSDYDANEVLFYLSPFLAELLSREDTPRNRESLVGLRLYLTSMLPGAGIQDPEFAERFLDEMREDLLALIGRELDRMDLSEVLLWGISRKCDQWIPGMILTEIARRRRPDLPVVLGGATSEAEARTIMGVFTQADFAIWGEGEVPLLRLVRELERGTSELGSIPRLLYRDGGALQASRCTQGEEAPFGPDNYDDYFRCCSEHPPGGLQVAVSLNTTRGCRWQRCRFCILHQHLPHREKEPQLVVQELRDLARRHGVERVHFANQDFKVTDAAKFEALLDMLIALRCDEDITVELSADVSPLGFTFPMFRKMALAGFWFLLIGFEAMTDGLLEKMDKAHRFAHNIHFHKFADRFKLMAGSNIIQGIPGESRSDVLESIQNLHYLRFYPLGRQSALWLSPMRLNAGSPFELEMAVEEKRRWVEDDMFSVYAYMPERFTSAGNRLHLGSFLAPIRHVALWDQFKTIQQEYNKIHREYRWHRRADEVFLLELKNREMIKQYALEPLEFEVLRAANHEVRNVEQVLGIVNDTLPGTTLEQVEGAVQDLQRAYLLYADRRRETLVSVVDTDLL